MSSNLSHSSTAGDDSLLFLSFKYIRLGRCLPDMIAGYGCTAAPVYFMAVVVAVVVVVVVVVVEVVVVVVAASRSRRWRGSTS